MTRSPFAIFFFGVMGVLVGAGGVSLFSPRSKAVDETRIVHTLEAFPHAIDQILSKSLTDFKAALGTFREGPGGQEVPPEVQKASDNELAREESSRFPAGSPSNHLVVGKEARRGLVESEQNLRLARLADLEDWNEQVAIRRRWLLVPEQDALDWFGMPDDVFVNEGLEAWVYDGPDGPEKYYLRFHNGRLIAVDT